MENEPLKFGITLRERFRPGVVCYCARGKREEIPNQPEYNSR